VSGLSLQTDAFVLAKRDAADPYQGFDLFSPEHGGLRALQRLSRKAPPTQPPLDLFDEADLVLESSNEGRTWFVREARIVVRRSEIGRSYDTLLYAAGLCTAIARNPIPEEGRAAVTDLLRTALAAFVAGKNPEIVYIKGLYRLARDEGYPVREEWIPSLAEADRAAAISILNQPSDQQTADAALTARVRGLLEAYLENQTEIRLR